MIKKNEFLDLSRNVFGLRQRINAEIGAEYGLTPLEVDIILFIYLKSDDSTAADIERERRVKKNTISIHVENLVQMGYIERREMVGDRRMVKLVLTDKALVIAKKSLEQGEKLGEALSENLTKEDIEVLRRCFEIVNANAAKLQKGEKHVENKGE